MTKTNFRKFTIYEYTTEEGDENKIFLFYQKLEKIFGIVHIYHHDGKNGIEFVNISDDGSLSNIIEKCRDSCSAALYKNDMNDMFIDVDSVKFQFKIDEGGVFFKNKSDLQHVYFEYYSEDVADLRDIIGKCYDQFKEVASFMNK